jgi:monoamine oxidase
MKKKSSKKIIIIGAGIAGLAAYHHLKEHGMDAMILEARDRCGGRIWTTNKLGIPLGLGANWIHGNDNNPIAQLATRFHANMSPVDPNDVIIFDRHDKPIPNAKIQHFNIKFERLLKQAKELACHSEQDMSLLSALSKLIPAENFSLVEEDLFAKKCRSFEGYLGAGCESLSARHWDQDEPWPGDNCFLPSSYQPIINGLQKNCLIQLNTLVKAINTHNDHVEIITENEVFYADAVIVTLPLGILKKNLVSFSPALPDNKQQAIQRLGMGIFNITALKFPTAFWPEKTPAIYFTPSRDLPITIFFNAYRFTQQPILIGYSGGEYARQLEALSDSELIEKTMRGFKSVWGSTIPKPESWINTRWSCDPFSYGSFSYVATGASGTDFETMAEPVANHLFFAGEATSKHPGTTHGAYLSGIREAEKIIKLALS